MNELVARLLDDLLAGGAAGTVVAVVLTYVVRSVLKGDLGPQLVRVYNLLVKIFEILKDGEITADELAQLDEEKA